MTTESIPFERSITTAPASLSVGDWVIFELDHERPDRACGKLLTVQSYQPTPTVTTWVIVFDSPDGTQRDAELYPTDNLIRASSRKELGQKMLEHSSHKVRQVGQRLLKEE